MESEDKILLERIRQAVGQATERQIPRVFGFFSPRQQELARSLLARERFSSYVFDGGYDGAQRRCLCIHGERALRPDIQWIRMLPDSFSSVSHRDYMGAILGLGLERRLIGDILTTDRGAAYAALFNENGIAEYIASNLKQVGRASVKTERVGGIPDLEPMFETLFAIVTSLRIDCVVAAVCRLSRAESERILKEGKALLNDAVPKSGSVEIKPGDEFSVRGYGKYRYTSLAGQTGKGRWKIEVSQYTIYTERKK